MADLDLQAYVIVPGSLSIELGAAPAGLFFKAPNILAPLTQPVLDSGPMGNAANAPVGSGVGLLSKAWAQGWATPVSKRLVALGGNTQFQLLTLECPSWDQSDKDWGATGTIDATTDPVTFTATQFGTSNYGRSFAVGDYVLWNDPAQANGLYQYEIDQIAAINQNTFTLQRRSATGDAGRAQFGTVKAAHAAVNFYQLIDSQFNVLWAGDHQVFKFAWERMIVAAVSATTVGLITPTLLSLIPLPPDAAIPGLLV